MYQEIKGVTSIFLFQLVEETFFCNTIAIYLNLILPLNFVSYIGGLWFSRARHDRLVVGILKYQ